MNKRKQAWKKRFGAILSNHLKIGLLSVGLAFIACTGDKELFPSQDDMAQGGEKQDEAVVAFNAKGKEATTRATVTAGLRKIGVFGYSHIGNFESDLAMRFPDFFLNQAVTDLPGDGTWTYSGVRKYWPQDGRKVSFFAYAPYIDVEDTFDLYPAAIANAGAPTITYTVPAGIIDQIDLVYGNRLDMTYDDSDNGEVELTLDHALTRVDFVVKLDEKEMVRPFVVEFSELTVRNVVGSGTLNLATSMEDGNVNPWTTVRPADDAGWASYRVTSGRLDGLANLVFDTRITAPNPDAGEIDAWNWNRLFITGHYLMLIPQELQDKGDGLTPAEMSLKYTVTNVFTGEIFDKEQVIPLWLPSLPAWKPGMAVTYQLTISILEGIEMEFDIFELTPWVDQNSGSPITGSVG